MAEVASQEKTGSFRHTELDIAKFLAILFMIFVHTCGMGDVEYPLDNFYDLSLIRLILYGGCMCAAMVFMFCMGASLVFSRRTNRKHLMGRALMMFVLGVFINIAVYTIQWLYDGAPMDDATELLISFFATDVYFFFALAFLCFIPIIESKDPRRMCVAMIIVILAINTVLNMFEFSGGLAVDTLIGPLFRDCPDSYYSYFPLIPWMVFPLLGYLFGTYLKEPDMNKTRLYLTWAAIGAIIMTVMSAYQFLSGETITLIALCFGDFDTFYGMSTFDAIWSLAHLMVWMLLMLGVAMLLEGRKLGLVNFCSKNVMVIYFLQWVFIPLFKPVLNLTESISEVVVVATVITIIVFAVTYAYVEVRKRMSAKSERCRLRSFK